MKPTVCYLDLDGVLVDFDKGACRTHNIEVPYAGRTWDWPDKVGIPRATFWGAFNYEFWAGLDWTSEGREILKLAESYFGDNIAIVTSPPKTPGAVEGKLAWVAREMPKYKRKCFVGARKELLAAPSKILIDDRDENVERFLEAGGNAFLVGRPWNKQAERESSILEDLERALNA